MNQQENKMGTQPIGKLLLSMSLPAMLSMLINALYNVLDGVFVAQLGENAFTAISLAFPIQTMMIAVAVGTGVGLNSLISRRLGEKRPEEASSAADHGFFLGIVSGLVFAVLGLIFVPPFFRLFTDDAEVLALGYTYGYIVTGFSISSFMQIIAEKMIQSTGNMMVPMVSGLVGATINLILDPIFIFGYFGVPAMGVAGAAITNVVGQCAGLAICMVTLLKKQHSFTITIKGFRVRLATVKEIYSVGLPSIVMQSIAAFLVTALNGILISFSGAAVSVLGAYYKLQSFIFMPVFGITQGALPIMGYNYGAGSRKRLMEALKLSTIFAILIMLLGTLLFNLIPDKLLMVYNASPEMLEIGVPALRTISLGFVLAAVGIMCSTFFQATGNGRNSLIVSVLRQVVFVLPAAYLFSKPFGAMGVWMAFPIAEVAAVIFSVVLLYRLYKNSLQHLAAPESV